MKKRKQHIKYNEKYKKKFPPFISRTMVCSDVLACIWVRPDCESSKKKGMKETTRVQRKDVAEAILCLA